jgi:hypothetical protein
MNQVGIHWLRGTFPAEHIENVLRVIGAYFEGPAAHAEPGMHGYTDRYDNGKGFSISFDDTPERSERLHNKRALLNITGDPLCELLPEDLLALLKALFVPFHFRPTRIDAFWDDFDRNITPHEIADECEMGRFAPYRTFSRQQSKIKTPTGMAWTTDMVTLGRRGDSGSGRYLRIYDKNLESEGGRNCIRWELELAGDYAKQFLEGLTSSTSTEDAARYIGEIIGGCVDFRDAEGANRHSERMERLEWWQAILDEIGLSKLRAIRITPTLERAWKTLERQWATTIAMLKHYAKATGETHVIRAARALVRAGESRLTKKHWQRVTEAISYFKETGACLLPSYERIPF